MTKRRKQLREAALNLGMSESDAAVYSAKALEREAAQEEANGNLVFRDEAGKPVAVLDTSNL